MTCICSSFYPLRGNLSVITALKIRQCGSLEIVIIFRDYEQIILSEVDWVTIKECHKEIHNFFEKKDEKLTLRFNNHEVLTNLSSREIIIKSISSWQTIRLNFKSYLQLESLRLLITNKINELKKLVEPANQCLNQLITNSVSELKQESNILIQFYMESDGSIPPPPAISYFDIKLKLLEKRNLNDIMNLEIVSIYEAYLVEKIYSELLRNAV